MPVYKNTPLVCDEWRGYLSNEWQLVRGIKNQYEKMMLIRYEKAAVKTAAFS